MGVTKTVNHVFALLGNWEVGKCFVGVIAIAVLVDLRRAA